MPSESSSAGPLLLYVQATGESPLFHITNSMTSASAQSQAVKLSLDKGVLNTVDPQYAVHHMQFVSMCGHESANSIATHDTRRTLKALGHT